MIQINLGWLPHNSQMKGNTMANKITKRENFEKIIAVLKAAGADELVEVMEHETELLAKKNSTKSKAEIAKAEANAALAEQICGILADGVARRCGDIHKAVADDEISANKVSAILRSLITEGKVKREETKGVAYFSLAE